MGADGYSDCAAAVGSIEGAVADFVLELFLFIGEGLVVGADDGRGVYVGDEEWGHVDGAAVVRGDQNIRRQIRAGVD